MATRLYACRENLHEPIKEQHKTLRSKLRGYYQYYGIRGNFKMLEVVFEHTERAWRRWLGRRCSKGYVSVEEFDGFYRKVYPLPKPRIIHNFWGRRTATVMRQTGVTCLVSRGLGPAVTDEPDALIGHVRVCGGSGGQPLLLPGSPTRKERASHPRVIRYVF